MSLVLWLSACQDNIALLLQHTQIKKGKYGLVKIVSDDYKPDGDDDDDDDESCSSGVDENESEDEVESEGDIDDIAEKVHNKSSVIFSKHS